jgi:pilus assembly protein CpaE
MLLHSESEIVEMPVYLWTGGLDRGARQSIEARLRSAIPDLVTISNVEDALRHENKSPAGRAYVLAELSSKDQFGFSKLMDIAARHRDQLFFILISDAISIDDYKRIARTEGADWVSTDANVREILDIIGRDQSRIEAVKTGQPSERSSVAISFVPSAGGVGNTTLAVETGVLLTTGKATRGRKICLIDLDFQSSNVCDYLDVEPRLQIQEISADPERLDAQLFDIFISRHASGLDVFAAPRTKFEYRDLDIAALDTLLSMAAVRYDLILVDCPVTWFSWTPKILGASDAVLVTGMNTVPGLRQIAETLAAIRRLPQLPNQIVVAVNRCRRRLFGGIIQRNHVETVLGREQVFYVGEEAMALESINTGAPMASNKSYRAIGKDIAALASFCADISPTRMERA